MKQPSFYSWLKIAGICVVSLFYVSSQAQTAIPPKGINYQAIARDTTGKPLSNCTNLSVKFTIWDSLTGGTLLFHETHLSVSTNRYGLFTRVIGNASPSSFDSLNWASGAKYLGVSIDSGGTGFVDMPRTQMVSVPYAFHSKTADSSLSGWSLSGNPIVAANFLGTKNSQDLIIKTNNAERMRVSSSGNIGIGTSAPISPLTIQTLVGNELEFISTGTNADIHANSQFNIGSSASLHLQTAGSTRLYVSPLGNIGVGTTSPGALFDVTGGQIKITDGSEGAGKVLTSNATGLASWTTLALPYALGNGLYLSGSNTLNTFWTALGSNIYNNNSGSVGIGTSTPNAELEVVSSSTALPRGIISTEYANSTHDAHIWLRKARGTESSPSAIIAGDELGFIKFRGYDGSSFNTNDQTEIGAVAAENFSSGGNGSYLKFMTTPIGNVSGYERMRITSGGRVGINTTSPGSALDVDGTITVSGGNGNELNRTQTGNANLAPIAYASINSSGTMNANTGNISSVTWDTSNSRYKIKISGENYSSSNYITLVTLIGTNANAKVEADDDGNGFLIITIWSAPSFKVQNAFQFVTYKP
jgi:hypothetical protein